MSELKLKFGEREIVLSKLLGTYWSGSISLAEYDGAWIATLYYSACHDQTGDCSSPQAALDALAEKVRGHIRELQGLVGEPEHDSNYWWLNRFDDPPGFFNYLRSEGFVIPSHSEMTVTKKLTLENGVEVTEQRCTACNSVLSSVMGPIA
jgi:hypothetical protein